MLCVTLGFHEVDAHHFSSVLSIDVDSFRTCLRLVPFADMLQGAMDISKDHDSHLLAVAKAQARFLRQHPFPSAPTNSGVERTLMERFVFLLPIAQSPIGPKEV